MSFLIPCPNCGERPVVEFRFGGERLSRPAPGATEREWATYFYARTNAAGEQSEWWYHKFGCRRWLVARRDTVTNAVSSSRWPNGPQAPRREAAP